MPKFPLGTYLPKEKKTESPRILFPFDSFSRSKARSFINEIENLKAEETNRLAGGINYVKQLPPIRSQGDVRFTCTAFAITCLNEFSFFRKSQQRADLSEEHLFFETKILEGNEDCGSWVANAIQVASQLGQCRESTWSYNPNGPCVPHEGKPSNADAEAISFRNTFIEVPPAEIDDFKHYLSLKRLIAISIKVFDSWYSDDNKIDAGIITLPLEGEMPFAQGHSVAIVGYQDDLNTPGGGYFIIRNSWGKEWGAKNFYGSGYGVIPYDYIQQFCMEAYVC